MADRSRYQSNPSAQMHIDAAAGQTIDTLLAAIEIDAKRLVPVDTGELRSEISTEKDTETSGRLIADTDYAAYVELGTSRAPAQSFMRPAVYRQRSI